MRNWSFTAEVSEMLENLTKILSWANAEENNTISNQHACQTNGLYGDVYKAIKKLVYWEGAHGLTTDEVNDLDWNWGGNKNYLEDIYCAIDNAVDEKMVENNKNKVYAMIKVLEDNGHIVDNYCLYDCWVLTDGKVLNDWNEIYSFMGY